MCIPFRSDFIKDLNLYTKRKDGRVFFHWSILIFQTLSIHGDPGTSGFPRTAAFTEHMLWARCHARHPECCDR